MDESNIEKAGQGWSILTLYRVVKAVSLEAAWAMSGGEYWWKGGWGGFSECRILGQVFQKVCRGDMSVKQRWNIWWIWKKMRMVGFWERQQREEFEMAWHETNQRQFLRADALLRARSYSPHPPLLLLNLSWSGISRKANNLSVQTLQSQTADDRAQIKHKVRIRILQKLSLWGFINRVSMTVYHTHSPRIPPIHGEMIMMSNSILPLAQISTHSSTPYSSSEPVLF